MQVITQQHVNYEEIYVSHKTIGKEGIRIKEKARLGSLGERPLEERKSKKKTKHTASFAVYASKTAEII